MFSCNVNFQIKHVNSRLAKRGWGWGWLPTKDLFCLVASKFWPGFLITNNTYSDFLYMYVDNSQFGYLCEQVVLCSNFIILNLNSGQVFWILLKKQQQQINISAALFSSSITKIYFIFIIYPVYPNSGNSHCVCQSS